MLFRSYDEPKRHIVLSRKKNIVGVEDKTDMSEYYDKFHEIPPFAVVEELSQEQWVSRGERYRQGAEHVIEQLSTCHDDGARRSRRRVALQR